MSIRWIFPLFMVALAYTRTFFVITSASTVSLTVTPTLLARSPAL